MEEANDKEFLFIRRALSGHKNLSSEEQRKDIFHTRCTING